MTRLEFTGHRDLQHDLAAHLQATGWLTFTEIEVGGWGSEAFGRVDVAAVKPRTYARKDIRAYEVKATRSDLLRDLAADKFRKYLEMFHRVYFAVPTGIVKLEELPKDVGLIVRGTNGWSHVRAARGNAPPKLNADFILALLYRGYEEHRVARDLRERLQWKDGIPVMAHKLGYEKVRRYLRMTEPPPRDPLEPALQKLRDLLEEVLGEPLTERSASDYSAALKQLVRVSADWKKQEDALYAISGFLGQLVRPWDIENARKRLDESLEAATA